VAERRDDRADEGQGTATIDDRAEPSPLGAAEPVVVGGEARTGGRGWRPKAPRAGRWLLLVPVLLVGLALAPTFVSGFEKTPRDRVGISYGGGPFEGTRYQRTVQPGSSLFFNGFFDSLYLYPSDQVNYIISEAPEEGQQGRDAVVAPTRDRVQATYQVAVYFKLNTDQLRDFHEQLGLRYEAYTTDGWNALVRDTFRQQIENALQEETRKVDVADLFGNADLLVELQDNVQAKLSQRLEAALGQPFFCAPTFEPGGECGHPAFVIKRVDIPASVTKAFEEVRQREAEAEAIETLGLTGQEYTVLRAIESGGITFWVLPDDSGVTITAPSAGGGSRQATAAPRSTTTTAPSGADGG
jgi:regulator of protease activity HflC (stomatin/prohibitin superfamily)